MSDLRDAAALITIMLWPVVPLFWIPVHGLPRLIKKLGLLSYAIPVVTWVPVVCVMYLNRAFLLMWKIQLPGAGILAGWLSLIAGIGLHLWTGKLLGLRGLIGVPEITPKVGGRLVSGGPFSVVRHPTYLAHTLMFFGVFLITGVISLGVVTLIDLITINVLVIPLEDRELTARFGREYEEYKQRVPAFFPKLRVRRRSGT